jgi:6-phosphogluconolactonase (cycloisomerase 2 family)
MKINPFSYVFFIFFLFFTGCKSQQISHKTLLFIGSFTDIKSGEGIKIYEFNNKTGKTNFKFTFDSISNPSFLRIASNGKFLYSVVDSQKKHHGKVAAFKIDSIQNKISLINMQDCGGVNPAHLAIDKTGNFLVNSNYTDGSLTLFNLVSDGSISENKQVIQFKDSSVIKSRQQSAHIHSSNFSPDNKFLFAHDLGADKIRAFEFVKTKEKRSLENQIEIKTKLGSGPRHFTFDINGKFGYLINELSGKIDRYIYNNGNLNFIDDYPTYQQSQDIYRAADIHISPDGKFLYASNRGPEEDSIVIFSINQNDGKLQLVAHQYTYGKHPRNFAIDPSGNFLVVANQFSNNIVVFKRDIKTGRLTKLSNEIRVNNPSSLQMRTYYN